MRRLFLAMSAPALCLSLAAQGTGRISGKVTTSDGKPVAGAKITLKRTDRNWTKEVVTGKDGSYLQIGLEPVEYDITVTAPGFLDVKDHGKVPLGDNLARNYTMRTSQEQQAQQTAQVAADNPAAAAETEANDAYNQAVGLVSAKQYKEAEPLLAKAYEMKNKSIELETKDEEKARMQGELAQMTKVYGIAEANLGKKDAALTLLQKAEELYTAKQDLENAKKVHDLMGSLTAAHPEEAYNAGVEAFNANKFKEAKAHFQKAIEIDPKFGDAYYWLAMVEFNQGNNGGAKNHFRKYLEVAPSGKHAAEVKEFLKAL